MKRLLQHSHWSALGLFLSTAVLATPAIALETDVRLKGFTTTGFLPSQDIQRQQLGTPSSDSTVDLRLMFKHDAGPVRLIADHSTILLSGDAVELQLGPDATLDRAARS